MNENPRRYLIKQLAASGLLSGIGISGVIREALANSAQPIKMGMHKVTGTVLVNGTPAQSGMSVGRDATIVTTAGSEAIFVIGQDAYLQREKSKVSFSAKTAGLTADVMRVITGGILSVFGKGEKKLLTPTATIGIRGTGCYIEAEATRVYFCLCYGAADVIPTADPKHIERIVTKHHDYPIYIYQKSSMPMLVKTAVNNHSDAELELLESLVGRLPPFDRSDFSY